MIDNGRILYKIRDRNTGLWSRGGYWASSSLFGKAGKVWNGIGPLKCHLRAVAKRKPIPDSWEVVGFHMPPSLLGSCGVPAASLISH